jgi:serine/threonine protein kinase/tetratricopeptide (TPR) repeat protein
MSDRASWNQVKAVFQAALDHPQAARAPFVRDACRGDVALQAEVDALLDAHDRAGDFAEAPIFAPIDGAAVDRSFENRPARDLDSGDCLGRYTIVAPLGRGAMGVVYRARDPRLAREVAIKVLPPAFSGDADRLERFEREARAAAGVTHANVLAVHDVGVHEGSPYIVSELLDGQTLRDALEGGPLRPTDALGYVVQIAAGVAAAHANGIVHRDIKPANVFVTTDQRVKILDFGLAKLITVGADSVPGLIIGTAGYMAPEQVRGGKLDARVDVFAIGCVLHEMLSGAPAFAGETAIEIMTAILNDEPRAVETATSDPLARGLLSIARHCLEKDPARRFQSALDVALAVDAVSRTAGVPAAMRAVPAKDDADERGISRMAVLPFDNLSRSPADEWLAGAFADSLTLGLADAPGVILVNREHVVGLKDARSDPQRLSEILGLRYYVAGSYQRVADDIRVVARLVDAAAGTIKVQESLTDKFEQLLTIQDDLARRFTAALRPPTAGGPYVGRTSSLSAYKAFADARDLHLGGRYREAISRLDAALSYDEAYAEAWALLAKSFARLSSPASLDTVAGSELQRQALRAALRAVDLAPQLYDAQVALALAYRGVEDVEPWRAAAQRAIDLNPRVAEGYVLLGQSYFSTPAWGFTRERNPELAERYYRKGLAIDPRFGLAYSGLIQHLSWAGREHDALRVVDDALRLLPEHVDLQRARAMALLWLTRVDEAERQLSLLTGRIGATIQDEWQFGAIALLRGDQEAAAKRFQTVISRDPRPVRFIYTARIYCAAGRVADGARHLRHACEAEAAAAAFVSKSPAFAAYRSTPEIRSSLRPPA